jgi:hypothetical protein
VANLLASSIGGYSLDLAFDDALSEFAVINQMKIEYFNTNWVPVQTTTRTNLFDWALGEGYGLLMNSSKRPVKYNQDGVSCYVLAASTIDSTADTTLWANWVAGDLKCLVLPLNAPPTMAMMPSTNLVAGSVLNLVAPASDPNVPPLSLGYSLQQAPTGMTINASSGLISWRPKISQSPSTNLVIVKVTGNEVPPLTATQSFFVIVTLPSTPVVSLPALEGNIFSLLVNGIAGPDYILQATTNLTLPVNWRPVVTNSASAPPFRFSDPVSNSSSKFYRVKLGP